MIKGLLQGPEGKAELVFLGITAGNVTKLKQGKPILVRGADIGLVFDICIAYEETEKLLTSRISKYVGKDTVVRDHRTEQQILDDDMRTEAHIHKMGATGDYPEGSQNAIDESDEGGLRMGIAVHPKGRVVMNFGKSVAWVAMPPEQALALAETLTKGANEALALIKKS